MPAPRRATGRGATTHQQEVPLPVARPRARSLRPSHGSRLRVRRPGFVRLPKWLAPRRRVYRQRPRRPRPRVRSVAENERADGNDDVADWQARTADGYRRYADDVEAGAGRGRGPETGSRAIALPAHLPRRRCRSTPQHLNTRGAHGRAYSRVDVSTNHAALGMSPNSAMPICSALRQSPGVASAATAMRARGHP